MTSVTPRGVTESMTARYTCRHHGVEETTHADPVHRLCGHDGTLHYACRPEPAIEGTPRPEGWPVSVAWRTVPLDQLLGPVLAGLLATAGQQKTAARILRMITDREGGDVACAWMIGMNPHLGDEEPVMAIADGRGRDAEAAARAYLEGVWT